MTFTYDLAALADTSASGHKLAYIRWRLSDNDFRGAKEGGTAIFQDEEIEAALTRADGDVGGALVQLATTVLAKLARRPNMTADWLTVSLTDMRVHWRKVLADIRGEFGLLKVGKLY